MKALIKCTQQVLIQRAGLHDVLLNYGARTSAFFHALETRKAAAAIRPAIWFLLQGSARTPRPGRRSLDPRRQRRRGQVGTGAHRSPARVAARTAHRRLHHHRNRLHAGQGAAGRSANHRRLQSYIHRFPLERRPRLQIDPARSGLSSSNRKSGPIIFGAPSGGTSRSISSQHPAQRPQRGTVSPPALARPPVAPGNRPRLRARHHRCRAPAARRIRAGNRLQSRLHEVRRG